jgi:hypothetical protein
MSRSKNPWEIGPTELIEFALERMHGGSDFDRRLAYLILDVGVETLIKTYLTLPENVTGVVTSSDERYKAAKGNFHTLVDGLQDAVPDKAHDFEIENIRYYHKIRNTLYHQGDTVSAVRSDHLVGYAKLAVKLLNLLFRISLSDHLEPPEPIIIKDGDSILESREVVISQGRFRIERYSSKAIKVINVQTGLKEVAKPFLRDIIDELKLDVNQYNSKGNERNTQQLGKEVLNALKISAWHGWIEGQELHREKIVARLTRRIRDGHAEENKWEVIDYMNKLKHDRLVFSPYGKGFANSPFNYKCWRTVKGEPIK